MTTEGQNLPAVIPTGAVTLPVNVNEAVRQWEEYQELTRRLLDDSDYQGAGGGRRFKKKSAWRKYARAFNITDEVTHEEISRADDGFPIYARIRVRATWPTNGRQAEADHECHVGERCCPAARNQDCDKKTWRGHRCCTPACDGRMHWSHPGDLPATALTRAKNRAISDLIGAGEVSAEEMDGTVPPPQQEQEQQQGTEPGHGTCAEHGIPYFQSGKMRSPAHKLDGGGWCNKPAATEPAKPPAHKQAPVAPRSGDTAASERARVAIEKLIEGEPGSDDWKKARTAWINQHYPDLMAKGWAAWTDADWVAIAEGAEREQAEKVNASWAGIAVPPAKDPA